MARRRSQSFDQVAELYDRSRPTYPSALFDHILTAEVLESVSRSLEVGCGTGQATRDVLSRGVSVLALEPGVALAELARQKCAEVAGLASDREERGVLEVVSKRLEDFDSDERFGLLFSAQAFHWIPTELGCQIAARLLQPGGTLALFWNLDLSSDTEFWRRTRSIYRQYLDRDTEPTLVERVGGYQREVNRCGLFSSSSLHEFPWQKTYSGERYLELVRTYSDTNALPKDEQEAFLEALRSIVIEFGGEVTRRYVTRLILARK